ncbi:arginine-tRNA-protein transferase [Neolewinella xylanilytica]|uniref:Arginine-tRNA-protein transferase n=1 Tax=Neolewinella xylanilytica TaxID=1514080 RepID=A0A2S6IAB2_9BACT|nr:GNAT family N-acetyltransferase [Neolewinella xylanilytica]PPK88399.1 arginine-tRNA-protein transferase [Neolewinella xylanilytica]
MATHIIHPRQFLDPDQLDAFLERGWRPTGQSIYTSDYLRTDDDELHGCLQIRLPLSGFDFKKRHRKLLRRNARRFRAQHAKAGIPDQELRAVNRRYMAEHPDKTREDLEYNVINEAGQQVLNTHVLRIFEGERLVAFSYYDLGQRVVYAKAGIYDPLYASASLGLYTMLLEVERALELGFTHYYPGYYSPTFPAFDYKLRLGSMEYRDISTAEWRAHTTDPNTQPEDPLRINRRKLVEARDTLVAAGIRAEFREYPSFTGRFRPVQQGENIMLDAPQLLLIGRPLPLEFYFVLTYDNEVGRYRFDVVRTANLYDMRVQLLSREGVPRFTTPVVVHSRIVESELLPVVVRKVRERLAGTSPA